MRHGLAMAVAIFTMAAASPALAERRVAVHDFYGPNGRALRSEVANRLERQEEVVIISQEELQQASQRLGVDAFSPEGRKALARELLISAWVTGVVKKRGHKFELELVVYDGAEHEHVGGAELRGKSLKRLRSAVRDQLWDRAGEAVMYAVAPLPPGRGPVEESVAEEESLAQHKTVALASSTQVEALRDDSAEERKRAGSKDALRASLGFGTPYRSLSYSDPISQSLGDYRLSGAPMFDMTLAYFPGRHATARWPAYFGFDAAAQISIATTGQDREGNAHESRYDSYRVGLRSVVPVGRHALAAFSGYARSRFVVEPQGEDVPTLTPGVDYRMLRSGAGAEIAASEDLRLAADVAWLTVLSVGELGAWFPRATANGLELTASASYALGAHLFTRLSAAYRLVSFDFHTKPGDERVAGGATDQALTMAVAAGMTL